MTGSTRADAEPLADVLGWPHGSRMAPQPALGYPIRVEDSCTDRQYVLRAELPGVDPEKDVAVTVSGDVLTITAEKHPVAETGHSEFRYGTFTRSIMLPANADHAQIQAIYGNGILKITAALTGPMVKQPDRHVPVMINHHIRPS